MKKVKLFIVLAASLILLTGCWDRRELNEIGIVMAVGLDKDMNTGKFIVTCQIVNPSALTKEGGQEKPFEHVTAKGDSIFQAFREITKDFDRTAYFAHTKIIVISETIAKEGLIPYIGLFLRSVEIRPLTWLVIAKDSSVENILETSHGLEKIQAVYLTNLLKESKSTSESVAVNVLDFSKNLSSNGMNPIMGVMTINKSQTNVSTEEEKQNPSGVHFSGSAVFKKDKLVGYLNDQDTKWLNCIVNKMKSGIIHIPIVSIQNKKIAVEISSAKCTIIPEINGDTFSFTINIKLKGNIVEQQAFLDTSNIDIFNNIQKSLKQVIEQEIKVTIETVQRDLKSDVFGFGNALNKKYPKEWKIVEKDWDKMFLEVDYKVNVDATIRRTGALSKPMEYK